MPLSYPAIILRHYADYYATYALIFAITLIIFIIFAADDAVHIITPCHYYATLRVIFAMMRHFRRHALLLLRAILLL